MKKPNVAATLALTLLLGLSATGIAAAGNRGGAGGPGGDRGPIGPLGAFLQLDLTEEQRAELRAILDSFRPRVQETRDLERELRATMKQAVRDSGYNEALLRPIAQSIGAAAAESALLRAEMAAAMHAVLTPEQIEQLEALAEERAEQRGDRPQRPRR